ncbi:DinB family protein [Herbidospora galbida]|uniref:DinB family protein n=1 Tax=Herbidospora galbida TaxID=2575442 RepID=A0A4U3MFU8_9ACTN|nr:DinB family protein [Herbidospora galbida]TKK87312.1 DinB family protein [Herbidospora galbida]
MRIDPPLAGDERDTLVAFLDYHRDTLAMKCAGLTDEQLRRRAVEPSSLSLLGLVRHLADVERAWFRIRLNGEDLAPIFFTDAAPDDDFDAVDSAPVEEVFATWKAEIEIARKISAETSLDALMKKPNRAGELMSHRWILAHMLEEYARHNGHADFLRERIDGVTGE